MQYYSNYQRYNKKGQRLAIFGREVGDQVEIFVLTCSKKDSFNRKLARNVYESFLALTGDGETINPTLKDQNYHPHIYTILKRDSNGPKFYFLMHCKSTYYRYKTSLWTVNENCISTKILNKRMSAALEITVFEKN